MFKAYLDYKDYKSLLIFLEKEKKDNRYIYEQLKKYKPRVIDLLLGFYPIQRIDCPEYSQIIATIKERVECYKEKREKMRLQVKIATGIIFSKKLMFYKLYKYYLKKHLEYEELVDTEIEYYKKCLEFGISEEIGFMRDTVDLDKVKLKQKIDIGEYLYYSKDGNDEAKIFYLIDNHLLIFKDIKKSSQFMDRLLEIEKILKRLLDGFNEVTKDVILYFKYDKYSLSHRYPEIVYFVEETTERMKNAYGKKELLLEDIWYLIPTKIKEIEQVLRTIEGEKEYLEKSNEFKKRYGDDSSEELIASKTIKLETMIDEKLETVVWNGKLDQLRKLYDGLTSNKIINDCEEEIFLSHFKIGRGNSKRGITEVNKLQWNIDDNDFAGMIAVLVEKKLVPNHKKYKAFCSHFVNSRGEDFKNLAQSGNYMKNYSNLDEKLMEVLKNL